MDAEAPLVGRARELGRLLGVLPDPGLGHGRTAIVLGEPGIGKTRLLEALVDSARARGFNVAVARARPGTRDVRGGTLLDVLPAAPPVSDDASMLWWVRNALLGVTDHGLVVVDDVHLADDLSLAVCQSLADSGRVAVVVAARSTEPAPEGLAHLARTSGTAVLRLGPLDRESMSTFVEHIQDDTVSADSLDEIFRLTNGVPLAVRELVHAAADADLPVSTDGWQWDPKIAADPQLTTLLERRLGQPDAEPSNLLPLLVVADGPIPEMAAVSATSQPEVDTAIARGLLTRTGKWLDWSHALLGELANTCLAGNRIDRAHDALLTALTKGDLADPANLDLAANLDLDTPEPDFALQLAAAHNAAHRGRYVDAARHANAASARHPDDHDARLTHALAAISLDLPNATDLIRDALDTAATVTQLLDATGALVDRLFSAHGDITSVVDVVNQAKKRAAQRDVQLRLDALLVRHQVTALPPDEFLALASGYLDTDGVLARDRASVEGVLSVMLAVFGDVNPASAMARAAREQLSEGEVGPNRDSGFYGGALAALFSGNAIEATRIAEECSVVLVNSSASDAEWGHRSLRCTIGAARGHCNVGMPDFVRLYDAAGNLRHGILTRIYAVWELALFRDPDADRLWDELQAAPPQLRQGPAFLEGFAGIALLASHGQTTEAADTALALAEPMAPARSVAAWLLHDAARHGCATEVVDELDAIAGTQSERFLPAIFADSARAITRDESAPHTAIAAEFRARGFDLFAAEHATLAANTYRKAGEATLAARSVVEARSDIKHAGGPWTPIVDTLEVHPLTERQRQICRLVVAGDTNAEIADALNISKRTVENQLHRAYTTLGTDRHGLINIEL